MPSIGTATVPGNNQITVTWTGITPQPGSYAVERARGVCGTEGLFDVRFASGRGLETFDGAAAKPVVTQGVRYPLAVSWSIPAGAGATLAALEDLGVRSPDDARTAARPAVTVNARSVGSPLTAVPSVQSVTKKAIVAPFTLPVYFTPPTVKVI